MERSRLVLAGLLQLLAILYALWFWGDRQYTLALLVFSLPPIVLMIGVTLVMLYVRGAERGSAAGRWSTESGERGCRLCTEGAPAPFEPN